MEVINNKEKYLPIGTVVILKKEIVQYMIVGYLFNNSNDEKKDYIAVIYPEGFLSLDTFKVFNHEDIEKIAILGVESEKYKRYNAFLNKKIPIYKG